MYAEMTSDEDNEADGLFQQPAKIFCKEVSMEERRKLTRRHILGGVRIRPGTTGRWTEAVLTNISRGGVGLFVKGPINKDDTVTVKITYLKGGEITEVEEVRATVRWVQGIGGYNAAGVMFAEEIGRENFPNLSACLDYVEGAAGS